MSNRTSWSAFDRPSCTRIIVTAWLATTAFGAHAQTPPGRPHANFIQSQTAPVTVQNPSNSRPGARATALSYDRSTRSVSVIFRLPTSWNNPRAHYNDSDNEFYVLNGTLVVNGKRYTQGDYGFFPAGMHRHEMASPEGATVIDFYEGEHKNHDATAAGQMYEPTRLIERIDTARMPWQATNDLSLTLGMAGSVKLLRTAANGEKTWLVRVEPETAEKIMRPAARHAAVLEVFVLDGDLHSPQGVMRSGGYAWLVPGQTTGPFGTRKGFTALLRSQGGALNTSWTQAQEVPWSAPYAPDVSEQARQFVALPYDTNATY